MSGDTKVQAPPISQAEETLRLEQAESLRAFRDQVAEQQEVLRAQQDRDAEQQRIFDLLQPVLLESQGIEVTTDEEGRITAFDLAEDPAADLREEVEVGLLERSKAALAGELPVSPTLERELTQSEEQLRESLRRSLGPGFETSSPGIEALEGNRARAVELREAARRGELTLAEQLGVARGASNVASQQAPLSTAGLFSLTPTATLGDLFGGQASLQSGFQGALSPFAADRELAFRADQATAQNRASIISGLAGAAGTVAGTAIGAKAFG